MYRTITKSDFRDAFQRCGRGDQFSYDALGVIFDSINEWAADDPYEEPELDPIAVCCEFAEYENLKEFQDDYNNPSAGVDYQSIDDIQKDTIVLMIDNERFVIVSF